MKTYIDISTDETGKPEYSIHHLNQDALNDIKTALFIFRNMLTQSIKYEKYEGIDLVTRMKERVLQLDAFIESAKSVLIKNPA